MNNEAQVWRIRANEVADKLVKRDKLLELARVALDKIVHMGRRGDPHVDCAWEVLEMMRAGKNTLKGENK